MFLIIGSGMTANSAIDYCQRQSITYYQLPQWPAPQELAKLPAEKIPLFSQVILSPGIAPDPTLQQWIQQNGLVLDNDIGYFLANTKATCLLITGSNGKSTVVSLLEKLLLAAAVKAKAIGNIGLPVLDYLDNLDIDIFVIEVSSFQLETAQYLTAKLGYVTNITPDHLDRHGTMANYANIKAKVYQDCEYALINTDIMINNQLFFSDYLFPEKTQKILLSQAESKNYTYPELNLLGAHNAMNVMACEKILAILNIPIKAIESALAELKRFKGLAHRLEYIGSYADVAWYNDSKATNEASTIAAVISVPEQTGILILGGQTKGQKFCELIALIIKQVKAVVLIGESQDFFMQKLSQYQPVFTAENLSAAVQQAAAEARAGDTVLFSPACASFDGFANFEERGTCFKSAVKQYYGNKQACQ